MQRNRQASGPVGALLNRSSISEYYARNKKYAEHNRALHHNFIDYKKAFDRVWHEGLWAVMGKYNISSRLTEIIKSLSRKMVLNGGIMSKGFRTNIRVRQDCPLSPALLNLYLERIMTDALQDFDGTVSIGERKICNSGSRRELAELDRKAHV